MTYNSGDSVASVLALLVARITAAEATLDTITGNTGVLTLSNALQSMYVSAVTGTKIADISGVPLGGSPVVSPNDGRFVVSGNQSSGWKIVRGTSTVSAGNVLITVSATGATDVSMTLVVAPDAVVLQPPVSNPTSAKVIGPAVAADTGYQNLGGTEHSIRIERADSADTGTYSAAYEIYLFQDNDTTSPNYGFKIVCSGNSQYINMYYRNSGAWTQFSGGESGHNWGRQLLKEDVIDIYYANSTVNFALNGVVGKTFPVSVFQGKFPSGLGSYARFVKTGGTYTPKTTLAGGVISPLTVQNIDLDVNALPVFSFSFTGSPLGYISRIKDGLGNPVTSWKPAVLIENATKGKAQYRGVDKAPEVSVGYTYELTEANSDGSAKSGVVPISKSIVAPGPMQFGINITFDGYSNNPRRNRICNFRNNWSANNYGLSSWADPTNPQLYADFSGPTAAAIQQIMTDNQTTGNLTSGPNMSPSGDAYPHKGDGTGKGPVLEVVAPRISGQRTRLRWKGVAGNAEAHNINNVIKNPVAGSDGTYSWIDFDHVFNASLYTSVFGPSDTTNALFRLNISNGVAPTAVEAYYIDSNGNPLSTGYWDPDYINDQKKFVGHSKNGPRMMDVQRVINMYDRVFTSAHIADGMSRLPDNGWGYQMCFSFFEAIGVGGQVHIPLQADETYVRKAARLGAEWSARTKLIVAWELSNEIWNSGQPSYHKSVELGRAMGFTATKSDGNGGTVEDANGIRIQYNSFRHRQVMQWITDEYSKVTGASPYLKRVLGCWNNNPANSISVATSDALCLTFTDELQSAPYLGNGYGTTYPTAVADITDAHLDDYISRITNEAIPTVFGYAAQLRDYALSKGKSFGGYEGLLEDPRNGSLFLRLKNDNTRWAALVTTILTQYKSRVGGHYRGYYDNSLFWGLRGHISQDYTVSTNGLPIAAGMKAWNDFMAAQPTV